MAKRMHNVTTRKKKNDMRIVLDQDQLRQIDKGAQREKRKQAGMLTMSGAGAHGNAKSDNRRDRRDSKRELSDYKRGHRDND